MMNPRRVTVVAMVGMPTKTTVAMVEIIVEAVDTVEEEAVALEVEEFEDGLSVDQVSVKFKAAATRRSGTRSWTRGCKINGLAELLRLTSTRKTRGCRWRRGSAAVRDSARKARR